MKPGKNVPESGVHAGPAATNSKKRVSHPARMNHFTTGRPVRCIVCSAGLCAAAIVQVQQRACRKEGVDTVPRDHHPAKSDAYSFYTCSISVCPDISELVVHRSVSER